MARRRIVGLAAAAGRPARFAAAADEAATPFDAALYAKSASTKASCCSRRTGVGDGSAARSRTRPDRLWFDRAEAPKTGVDEDADLTIEHQSLLPANATFVDDAFIVEPADDRSSRPTVKVATSVRDVATFDARRTALLDHGRSQAGHFTVAAGQIVYIGHFAVDCAARRRPGASIPKIVRPSTTTCRTSQTVRRIAGRQDGVPPVRHDRDGQRVRIALTALDARAAGVPRTIRTARRP